MDYSALLQLFYDFINLISSCFSLYFSINVLFRKNLLKKSVNVSITMTLNFIFVFIFAILSIIYNSYLIILWRPEEVIYDPKVLYITGLIPWILINLNSIMEFFLCFDRCFALIFPFNYNSKTKFALAGLAVIGLLSCLILLLVINKMIPAYLTINTVTNCRHVGCLFQPLLILKISFLLVNLFGVTALALLIKFILQNNSDSTKRMNKTVLIMVLCTTFIELLPFLGSQLFFMVTKIQWQRYIGAYGYSASTVSISVTAGIYYKAFKKNVSSVIHSKVTVYTSTPTIIKR